MAETAAADAAAHVRVDAVELLEDQPLLGNRDAETLVADGDIEVPVTYLQVDLNASSRRGVLDRVRDDSSRPAATGRGPPAPAAATSTQRARAATVRPRAPERPRPRRRRAARRRRARSPAPARGVDPACEQDVVDHPGQSVRLLGDESKQMLEDLGSGDDVLALQGLGGAVDGRERRPELVGDGGDEVRLSCSSRRSSVRSVKA